MDAVARARRLLAAVTPLPGDCGALCQGACCQGGPDSGMLLFPGEERLPLPPGEKQPTAHGLLFACRGRCDRRVRPLACRLFPLVILPRDGGFSLAMDARGYALCPLVRGLAPYQLQLPFRRRVQSAARLLLAQDDCRAFLARAAAEHRELSALLPRR